MGFGFSRRPGIVVLGYSAQFCFIGVMRDYFMGLLVLKRDCFTGVSVQKGDERFLGSVVGVAFTTNAQGRCQDISSTGF